MTIIRGEPMWAYHANEAISNSKLSVFRDSPLLYKRLFIDGDLTKERTAALDEGAGFDSLLFDGQEKFLQDYACKPQTYRDAETDEIKKWNGNANVCKEWARDQEGEGRTVLEKDVWQRFVSMRTAIRTNPLAIALLSQGEAQVSIRRRSSKFDLDVQVRPDWLSEQPIEFPDLGLSSGGLPYVADLKTTEDFSKWFSPIDPNSPRQGKPVWDFGYHRQAGFQIWVAHKDIGKAAHFLLVCEKHEPFRVGVIRLSDEYLDLGWNAVEGDLTRLSACKIANKWPGSPERIITLHPPDWLLEQGVREAVATAGI